MLALAFAGSGAVSRAADPPDISTLTIQDVLQRGNSFIASTTGGLYQASPPTNVWRKIPTPSDMPLGGNLAQESPTSPQLASFFGQDFEFHLPGAKGALFLSSDAGRTWTQASLKGNVLDAFLHPDGSIYAVTQTTTTTPFPSRGNSIWTIDARGVNHYPSTHLVVSRDGGRNWKDITPPLQPAFGLWGIFRDPDHPDLVCVKSNMINHTSRTLIYQAANRNYFWNESHAEDWHNGREVGRNFFWGFPSGGTNNGDMPANLGNFLKYPYARSGRYPQISTKYLVTGKPAYHFRLQQPMPVAVTTFFMTPDHAIQWLDNKNEQIFWGIRIKPDSDSDIFVEPKGTELNIDYPDHNARLAAYRNDPALSISQVDQAHPWQRVVDLAKLYPFPDPGHYRLQLTHDDQNLDRDAGSLLGTGVIDLIIDP